MKAIAIILCFTSIYVFLQVNQMRQDNSYYKKQLQIHRDNLMSQNQEEDPEYKLKLIAKNQELSEAMEELQVTLN